MKKRTLLIVVVVITAIGVFTSLALPHPPDPAFRMGYPRLAPNDMYCSTSWIAQHGVIPDHLIIEWFLRGEIAALGGDYDIPERKIDVTQIDSDSIKVTIQGNWVQRPSRDVPDIGKLISKIDGIGEIEETTIVMCA